MLPVMLGQYLVAIPVEVSETQEKFPNFGICGMKDMRTMEMDLYAGRGIDTGATVAADGVALLQHQDSLSPVGQQPSDGATPNPGTDDDRIVHFY